MFDQEDYYSDEQENVFKSHKAIASNKVQQASSKSDFNHLTGDSESLLKMMKDRGIDLSDNEVKKMKVRQNSSAQKQVKQTKGRSGFFDGGASATIQELIKALNKSLSKADPQQASCVLSYILEKKNLPIQDLNKFGIIKCKILFGLGAYKDCEQKSQQLIKKASTNLNSAVFSNYLAKCKALNNKVLEGYIDLLRAKSYITQIKQQLEKQTNTQKAIESKNQKNQSKNDEQQGQLAKLSEAEIQKKKLQNNFKDLEIESVIRQVDYTQMEYNIKLTAYKNNLNVLYPYYIQFRHRKILQIACGDYHTLFLTQGSFDDSQGNKLSQEWKTQVFAVGENGVGQILGKSSTAVFKQPVIITQLSGKGIKGIFANKQSSIAYNDKGQIFQWGVKQDRNDKICVTYTVGQQIQDLQKGNKHYALLTKSKKFYTWGQIQYRNAIIYKQAKPHMQQSTNIVSFSCGNSCIAFVDSNGQAFVLGNNEVGQISLHGQYFSKTFKKISDKVFGKLKKIHCVADCTFYVNQQDQVFFTGRYSYNKQPQQSIRQAEFGGEIRNLISISGHPGMYYVTNQIGQIYQWSVDSNVKFRLYRQNEQINQRGVISSRGNLFRFRSLIQPEYCQVLQITQKPESYEDIKFQILLKDRLGYYGNKEFLMAPRCQICLSTYQLSEAELLKQNKQFLQRYKLSTFENRIILSQIIEPKIHSSKIIRDQSEPWIHNLNIVVDTAGKYFFYVLLEDMILHSKQLYIQVSIKQSEMSQKNIQDKKVKEQQRRRRAEEQRKRLRQQKLRKQQQQEEKRRQTQKRAQDALKKHMKQQQQSKMRQLEEKKARKQLQTGGGFDLTKLAKKKSMQLKQQVQPQMQKTGESLMKSTQCFLPDINMRPSSKRKLNFRRQSIQSSKTINPLQKTAGFQNDSKNFLDTTTKTLGKTSVDPTKMKDISSKLGQMKTKELSKTISTGVKTEVLKRGISRSKK